VLLVRRVRRLSAVVGVVVVRLAVVRVKPVALAGSSAAVGVVELVR
jgi:16S rRNA U516 pseudouridylate synthase RsuA-like enzyme